MTNGQFILDLVERLRQGKPVKEAELNHLELIGKSYDNLIRTYETGSRDEHFRRGDPGHPNNSMGM